MRKKRKKMFQKEEIKKINKETETLFNKMGFDVSCDISMEEDTLKIKVRCEEPQVLIGERGRVLASLQKILKAILAKETEKRFYLDLDINEYKEKKKQYLKEMANKIADEVSLSGKEKSLPPMPSYERRIIHLELARRENVVTESMGEEPDRKIVIRPYP